MRAVLLSLLALLVTAIPASAQHRFVSLDYKFDTDNDYVVLVDLNAVRRGGDISDALATIEHVEPVPGPNGRPITRRWLRMQYSCATQELRILNIDALTDRDANLTGANAVSNQQAQTIPAGSEIDNAMCGAGQHKPHWTLLNTSLMDGPDTRKSANPDVMRFPWPTLEAAVESYVRVRARNGMIRSQQERQPIEPKRVANLPYPVPGLVFTPLRVRYTDGPVGLHLVEQGYIDAGSVTQIGVDTYIYTVLGVARTAQSATGPRHPQMEVAIEVRCEPQPVQRYVGLDSYVADGVRVMALPGALMRWNPALLPFSKGLCDGQFDTTAKTHATLPPAMAELTSMVQAAARQ